MLVLQWACARAGAPPALWGVKRVVSMPLPMMEIFCLVIRRRRTIRSASSGLDASATAARTWALVTAFR